MLESRVLDNKNDEEVTGFLDSTGHSNPSVLGYHYPFYRDMLESIGVGEPLYIGTYSNNELVAVLPGFLKTSAIGTVYSSMPFFGPNAGLLCSRQDQDITIIYKETLGFLFKQIQDKKLISASFYSGFQNDKDAELLNKNLPDSLVVDKFTSYIDLQDMKLSTSLEYDLRKALKSGVHCRAALVEDARAIFDIYSKNCADYGIPLKPFECIKALLAANAPAHTQSYVAELNGSIIGALIMLSSPSVASYYLPCSIHEYRAAQPTTLLIHHAMEAAKTAGIRYWNWESSPSVDSGVYKFKKKWGSVDGYYKIFVKPFRPAEFYRNAGMEKIASEFPYFFVYPFNLLK